MILYVDKQSDNDAIGGYYLSSMEYKYFVLRNGRNIQGLDFDPATEKVFFTDTNERSINWISLKPGSQNNAHGNCIIQLDDGIPTDIAVDSCGGYIYWITTNLTTPTIERARFDGSEREVVINTNSVSVNATYKVEPHSLTIDQQTQKIFWVEPETGLRYRTNRADLSGHDKVEISVFEFSSYTQILTNLSSVLTVSKNSLFSWIWCVNCSVWEELKLTSHGNKVKKSFVLDSEIPVSITANYKIEHQIQGLQNCEALKSLVRNNCLMENSLKIATEYDGPFCVHGMKVNGQPHCKCTPGYIGERCDVTVCENYCLQGNCSSNDMGLPICSCNAGYSGERCEVDACHGYCQNNGDCSLNEINEPVCQCKEDFVGDRCEATDCLNYCIQGNCSFNDERRPTCSCNAGYSGKRCEFNACYGYCLNNGHCSLNEEDEPVCECISNHEGSRCEADINDATLTYDSVKQNLTLSELLFGFRKRSSKVFVIVEV